MADNVTLNPGTGGKTIKTDEIGGVDYPVSKIVLGDTDADDGLVHEGNPFPVTNRNVVGATTKTSADWSSNKVLITSSPAVITGLLLYNSNPDTVFVQFHNEADVGDVNLGTDAPEFPVPIFPGGAAEIQFTEPVEFDTGIVLGQSTTPTGSTGPTTGLFATVFHRSN